MPTTESTQYTAQAAASSNYAAVTVDARSVDGAVKYARFDVVTGADSAANDVISLGVLPPGAVVLPSLSKLIVTDDMTSGAMTIDIGDAADVDRYADGLNTASVGVVDFLTPAIPAGFTTPYYIEPGANQIITAKIITMGATIEAGAFSVILCYKTL